MVLFGSRLKPNPVMPGELKPVPLMSVVGDVLSNSMVKVVPDIDISIVADPIPPADVPEKLYVVAYELAVAMRSIMMARINFFIYYLLIYDLTHLIVLIAIRVPIFLPFKINQLQYRPPAV